MRTRTTEKKLIPAGRVRIVAVLATIAEQCDLRIYYNNPEILYTARNNEIDRGYIYSRKFQFTIHNICIENICAILPQKRAALDDM